MKLDELVGYDAVRRHDGRDDDPDFKRKSSLVDRLAELGFVPLSAGNYATIFTHPGLSYVIKIFRSDPCYLQFVKTALQHQDNPHFPKFIGKPIQMPGNKGIFGIRMERLNRFDYNDASHLSLGSFNVMNQILKHGFDEVLRVAEREKNAKHYFDGIQPSLINAFEIIRTDDPDCGTDLHIGNLMLRGTSTVVITDPFYSKSTFGLD